MEANCAGGPASALRARVGHDGLIGWVRGRSEGPLLLCVGGLHGNEPAGVRALTDLIHDVRARREALRGDFVAVVGNMGAVAADRRFLSYDLNRAWTDEGVRLARGRHAAPLVSNGNAGAGEDAEMTRLLGVLEQVAARARGPVHALDLHTTSGVGGTFTTTADRPRHRRFAMSIPFPLVLGVDQHLQGTLLDYLDRLGYLSAVCECGQHREPRSAVRARAAIWLAIRAAGLLPDAAIPEAAGSYRMLRAARRDLPATFEVVHRHPVTHEDDYETRPGFRNFQLVRRGEVIGDDRRGGVASPAGGLLLMPLYQELGEDGFFVIREAEGGAVQTGGALRDEAEHAAAYDAWPACASVHHATRRSDDRLARAPEPASRSIPPAAD